MKKILLIITLLFSLNITNAQETIGLYWDVSYSMKDRNLNKEFTYLNNFFKKHPNVSLQLVMFSNDIILEQTFTIKDGDWSALQSELGSSVYDGGTSYEMLFHKPCDQYIVSTDGLESINKFDPPTDVPMHLIATVGDADTIHMKLAATLSSGTFSHLASATDKKASKSKVKTAKGGQKGYISGTIMGDEGLLAQVNILNRNTTKGATSKRDGSYEIKADAGDILVFTYLGKRTTTVRVGKAQIMHITMATVDENLEEVVVSTSVEQEDAVNTGNTSVDKRRLGYDVETIGSDQVSDQDLDLINVAKGQFSNFEVPNDVYNKSDISQFIGRGKNMSMLLNQYGLIVVDGVPLAQSNSNGRSFSHDNIINPDMIASVTYLKGLAATNKYGTLGRNGVLLITTKNAASDKDTTKKDIPLGTTATYSGNAKEISDLPDTPYIRVLKQSTSVNEAFKAYLEQRVRYGDKPSFYLDVYDYFKGWQNPLLSKRILSNVYEIALKDTKALKALAYKQQAGMDKEGAFNTTSRILKLAPKEVQSYRDTALAFAEVENYKKALQMYYKLDKNVGVKNVNTQGLKKTIDNEARHFIGKHKQQLNMAGVNPKHQRPVSFKSRIIFEWNDLNAEFDLNVINPQKRYFTWSHTNIENSQRIAQQKNQGYGLEEFYLTDTDVGTWTFNMKYYGKTSKESSPTYIKITVYTNFGMPNETRSIKVVRLEQENVEQTIAKVLIK